MIPINDPRRMPVKHTTQTDEMQRRAKLAATDGIFGGPARRAVGAFLHPQHSPKPMQRMGGDIDFIDAYTVKPSADEQMRRDLERRVDRLHADVRDWEGNVPILVKEVMDQIHRAWLRFGKEWFILPARDIADAVGTDPNTVRAAIETLTLLGAVSQQHSLGGTTKLRSNLPFTRTVNHTKY